MQISGIFLPVNCSNFRLKQRESLKVTENVKEIEFEGGLRRVRIEKKFPETIVHKTFETNSRFCVK